MLQKLRPIIGRFEKFDNFRLEVHSDVISGAVIDPTGVKVHVKFGYSRSNRSRDIRLPHFVRTSTTPAYAGHHIRAKRRKDFAKQCYRHNGDQAARRPHNDVLNLWSPIYDPWIVIAAFGSPPMYSY